MDEIRVEHLKYKYPRTQNLVLNDISFTIKKGSFIGIIGENGSGKSSLCQAIAGLIPHFYKGAYGGKVLLGNIEVKHTQLSELCQKVGIVFQNPFNQITGAKQTVYEEIAFGLENLGMKKEEMVKRIDGVLEFLDLQEHADKNPFDLSGGQMQRMALAGIIVMEPDIILLDEPTSQLDPKGREEVYEAVLKLTQKGITILMVDHNMETIAKYCNQVILLQKGNLIAYTTPQELFSREDIKKYGVIEPIYTQLAKKLRLKSKETNTYPVTLEELELLYQERKRKCQ